jgi:hypothetical protein
MHLRQQHRSSLRPSRIFAGRGWRAIALRLLSLALVLAIAAPDWSLATDIAYLDSQTQAGIELPVISSADGFASGASDRDIVCHVHCSCQQAITVDGVPEMPSLEGTEPNPIKSIGALASVWLKRQSRPPRT